MCRAVSRSRYIEALRKGKDITKIAHPRHQHISNKTKFQREGLGRSELLAQYMYCYFHRSFQKKKCEMNKESDNYNPETGNKQTWATHKLFEKPGHRLNKTVFTELKETTDRRVGGMSY